MYVRKLLGYNFRIEYKMRSINKVADALSRVHEGENDEADATLALLIMSFPTPTSWQN